MNPNAGLGTLIFRERSLIVASHIQSSTSEHEITVGVHFLDGGEPCHVSSCSPSPNANQLALTFNARASLSTVSTAGNCRPFSMSPMVE